MVTISPGRSFQCVIASEACLQLIWTKMMAVSGATIPLCFESARIVDEGALSALARMRPNTRTRGYSYAASENYSLERKNRLAANPKRVFGTRGSRLLASGKFSLAQMRERLCNRHFSIFWSRILHTLA